MQTDLKPVELVITASSILLGFLFTGFWWALNRELRFRDDRRHFKLGYALLLFSIAVLAVTGVIIPLRLAVSGRADLSLSFVGIVVALLAALGYMFTEFGHYSVYRRQLYTTKAEKIAFGLFVVGILAVLVLWLSGRL